MFKILERQNSTSIYWETKKDLIFLFSYSLGWKFIGATIYGGDEEPFLALDIIFLTLYFNLSFLQPYFNFLTSNDNSYGFCFSNFDKVELLPDCFHLNWGRFCKIIDLPWSLETISFDYLNNQQEWKKFEYISGEYIPEDAYTEDFCFVYDKHDIYQEVDCKLSFFRVIQRPLLTKKYNILNHETRQGHLDFSEPIGKDINSWKGGTLRCSVAFKEKETSQELIDRLQDDPFF